MFVILKDLDDDVAYKVFALVHIPLYFIVIFILVQADTSSVILLKYVINIFLIGHASIHYFFRRNPNNRFISLFSNAIIYSLAVLAAVHIALMGFS